MRPKPNVIVVGIRPELRFMLRISGRVKVWQAETVPELSKCLRAVSADVVIIDYRDLPILAKKAVSRLRRFPTSARTILVTPFTKRSGEPLCDDTIREGMTFYNRLLMAMRLVLKRKRGPMKRITENQNARALHG
jgi:hypothetical protein